MNYFIFNKAMDYARGLRSNLVVDGGELRVREPKNGKPGLFLSRILDSREKETVWHRLVMETCLGDNMAVYLKVYASDSLQALPGPGEGEGGLTEAFLRKMDRFLKLTAKNPMDILLHAVKGRYLWFSLALHGNDMGSPVIRGVRLYFPKETWMRFLPEVYQNKDGEFLERYLCVFQSIYDGMEEEVRQNAAYLDLQSAAPELLLRLTKWLCVGNSHLWKPENLKQYLETGAAVYQNLGTPGALVHMVELYTGYSPYLREGGPGENPHLFRLYINEEAVASPRQYQALLRVVREGAPADMEVQVIALKPFVFLDGETYLGINSVLNQYGEAVLDSGSSIPYAVLGGGTA